MCVKYDFRLSLSGFQNFFPCVQDLRSQFDTCLSDGLPLLVTDVDVTAFVNDARFKNVVLSRNKFVAGRNPFKIKVINSGASFVMSIADV